MRFWVTGVYICTDFEFPVVSVLRVRNDIMFLNGTFVFCVLLCYFVRCSSIITKRMIRMPKSSFASNSSGSPMEEPSTYLKSKLQDDHPFNFEDDQAGIARTSLTECSELSDWNIVKVNSSVSHPIITSLQRQLLENSKSRPETRLVDFVNEHDTTGKNNLPISPEELSKSYWLQYTNFSKDFLTLSHDIHDAKRFTVNKQFPQTNVLEILQNVFKCIWSSGLTSCFQENSPSGSVPYLHFLMQSLPSIQQHEGFQEDQEGLGDEDDGSGSNAKFDVDIHEEDEGRKRFSKKLQSLLPFLLLLKMTMLPALAVMALVSGKALVMSLLSLVIGLLAATLPAPLSHVSASKRQEIAPLSSSPSDFEQTPNRYYYAMR